MYIYYVHIICMRCTIVWCYEFFALLRRSIRSLHSQFFQKLIHLPQRFPGFVPFLAQNHHHLCAVHSALALICPQPSAIPYLLLTLVDSTLSLHSLSIPRTDRLDLCFWFWPQRLKIPNLFFYINSQIKSFSSAFFTVNTKCN